MTAFLRPSAELFVSHLERSVAFYHMINFEILTTSNQNYVLVRLEENPPIGLYGAGESMAKHHYFGRYSSDTQRGYGAEFIFTISNIERYFRSVIAKIGRERIAKPLTKRTWGAHDFRISDPDGFYLRFTSNFDWLK